MPKEKVKLDWTEVESSNVQAIAHHEPSKTLCVRFIGGGLYSYMEADHEVYVEMLHAESVGKYLNQVVKIICPYTRWNDEAELIEHLSL